LQTTHDGQIAALNTRIAGLQDTNNQHIEALKTQLEGSLRQVKDEQERITKLEDANAKQASTIEGLQNQLRTNTIPTPQLTVQLNVLANTTATMAGNIGSLSKANTVLASTLSEITHRLEAPDFSSSSPTSTKPTLTSRSE
jgi:uncharacterized coiled-coil protein SlyX